MIRAFLFYSGPFNNSRIPIYVKRLAWLGIFSINNKNNGKETFRERPD